MIRPSSPDRIPEYLPKILQALSLTVASLIAEMSTNWIQYSFLTESPLLYCVAKSPLLSSKVASPFLDAQKLATGADYTLVPQIILSIFGNVSVLNTVVRVIASFSIFPVIGIASFSPSVGMGNYFHLSVDSLIFLSLRANFEASRELAAKVLRDFSK